MAVLESTARGTFSHTERLVGQKEAKLAAASSWPSTTEISAQPKQHLSCKLHPLLHLEPSCGSFPSPSNCRIIPWPLKGSRTPLVPTLCGHGPQSLPISPARCQGVAGSTVLGMFPSLLWRLHPTAEQSRYDARKQCTKLIAGTAKRKALSCPPPPWPVRSVWDLSGTAVGGKERKSAATAGSKTRLQGLAEPYLPCCWLFCWHVPPSAASTS